MTKLAQRDWECKFSFKRWHFGITLSVLKFQEQTKDDVWRHWLLSRAGVWIEQGHQWNIGICNEVSSLFLLCFFESNWKLFTESLPFRQSIIFHCIFPATMVRKTPKSTTLGWGESLLKPITMESQSALMSLDPTCRTIRITYSILLTKRYNKELSYIFINVCCWFLNYWLVDDLWPFS